MVTKSQNKSVTKSPIATVPVSANAAESTNAVSRSRMVDGSPQPPVSENSDAPEAAGSSDTTAAGLTSVEGARFEVLWLQFEQDAGLTSEHVNEERDRLLGELEQLEAKVAEKKLALEQVQQRVEAAKEQMRLLLDARLSDEAILTAMRIEHKVRRATPKAAKAGKSSAHEVSEEDKQEVLDHLDAEGLTLADLKTMTNKDGRYLRAVLEGLVADGKATKSGEKAAAKYHLV